jgi:predicted acyl esterase
VIGRDWSTSPRRFAVVADRDVRIPLPDGTELVGDVLRPDTEARVPVIAGFPPYNTELQAQPMMPTGFSLQRGWLESGDPYFFARRGYAHAIVNVRGTGKSTGLFQAMGPQEARDVADALEWLAARPWCTGRAGLFGISYFSWLHIQAAMIAPPSLAAIFAPLYLDRPLYQMHGEALRWFDHWLTGNDTGFLAEPAVRLFMPGTGEWRTAQDWPLPQTRWTEFYLHSGGLLSEHDTWPWDHATSFEDSPFGHGEVIFRTPPMVETTEILGPMAARLYASTTDTDALFFVTVFAEDPDGSREELTRGWLRASQAAADPAASVPWLPFHPHQRRDPVQPGRIGCYDIPVVPAACRLRPGQRLGIRVKAADDGEPADMVRGTAIGHVGRQNAAVLTIWHDEDHPSALLVPVTEGNVLGTFVSGGVLSERRETVPAAKIARQKYSS